MTVEDSRPTSGVLRKYLFLSLMLNKKDLIQDVGSMSCVAVYRDSP